MAETVTYRVMKPTYISQVFDEGSRVTFLFDGQLQRAALDYAVQKYVPQPGEVGMNNIWIVLKRIVVTTHALNTGEIVDLDPKLAKPHVENGSLKQYPPPYDPPEGMKRYKVNRDVTLETTVFHGEFVDLDPFLSWRFAWDGHIKEYFPPGGGRLRLENGRTRYEVVCAELPIEFGPFEEGEIIDLEPALAESYMLNGSLEPYGWSLPQPEDNIEDAIGVESVDDQPELPDPTAYATEAMPPDLFERMMTDRNVRAAVCSESHYAFFHFYLAHAVDYDTAAFQREMFKLSEDDTLRKIFIVAFRGSGKSTIFTTSYPLWAIMGKQQKKFIVILCDTLQQAKIQMGNIKQELEGNELLKNDLGPFEEDSTEWGAYSIVFKNFNARILVVSTESSIRGIRHGKYRPDLIIADDVESTSSVKTKEGRDKIYRWLKRDVIPAGEFRKTRLIIVGNLLHEDSLLMRLKREVKNSEIDGIFKAYPLIDKNGRCAWPDKYKTEQDLIEQEKEIGNKNAWLREYLLKIVPEDDQVITREMIHYYDKLPFKEQGHITAYLGVDLAIGQKETNDYTAMVSILTQGTGKHFRAYVLPNPVNERLRFPDIIAKIKERYRFLKAGWHDTKIRVETNQFQQAAVDQLKSERIYEVEGVTVTTDKRSRLASCADLMNAGVILFPKHGAEDLITQMTGFGVESHDDIMDAFTLLVRAFIDEGLIEDRYDKVVWL
jgi:predicted phage terminase large subunit-like protein